MKPDGVYAGGVYYHVRGVPVTPAEEPPAPDVRQLRRLVGCLGVFWVVVGAVCLAVGGFLGFLVGRLS